MPTAKETKANKPTKQTAEPKPLPKIPLERISELRFISKDEDDTEFRLDFFKRNGIYILKRVPK